MTALPSTTALRLETDTVDSLFARASEFGRVRLWTGSAWPAPEAHRVIIEFSTTSGITLEAASDHNLEIRAAFRQALERAEQIRGQFR